MMAVPTNQTITCTLHILGIICWVKVSSWKWTAFGSWKIFWLSSQRLKRGFESITGWMKWLRNGEKANQCSFSSDRNTELVTVWNQHRQQNRIYTYSKWQILDFNYWQYPVILFHFFMLYMFSMKLLFRRKLWTARISKILPSDVRLGNVQTRRQDLWAFLKGREHPME